MKTRSVTVIVLALFVLTTAFVPASRIVLPPTCPGNPTVTVTTDHNNYIHATALLKTYKDGYEWTVTGGFIISGQGTNQISIGPDCPTPGTITACVRAYINQPGGGICYSAEICNGVYYTGPCFIY
jgi:hypothetical protein